MLSPDFLFPRFLVFPSANPNNFSHCKCFYSRLYTRTILISIAIDSPPIFLQCWSWSYWYYDRSRLTWSCRDPYRKAWSTRSTTSPSSGTRETTWSSPCSQTEVPSSICTLTTVTCHVYLLYKFNLLAIINMHF